jgi:hypothetical protein
MLIADRGRILGVTYRFNENPHPRRSMADLNPQPLPPKTIPFDAFVETTTQAVLRAVQAQSAGSGTATPVRPPRIIIGIIAEPNADLSQSVTAD